MGQICSACGGDEEAKQPAAFADASSSDMQSSHHSQPTPAYPPYDGQPTPHDAASPALDYANPSTHSQSAHGPHGHLMEDQTEEERQKRLEQFQLEQAELARREAIVTDASRSMVPVGPQGSGHGMMDPRHAPHRGGGVNTYYDPAYAAAAAQDILRSAAMTGGLVFTNDKATEAAWNASVMGRLPLTAANGSKEAVESLGKNRWDGVKLGSRGSGLAGCGGEDPQYYLDDLSEAFLESMVPTRTSMFGGCASIVENLP